MELIGRAMEAIRVGFESGRDSWNRYNTVRNNDTMMRAYADRWAWYQGTVFNEAWRKSAYRTEVRVYRGVRLLLKHVEAVVDFYAMTAYQGALATDGRPLPDGTEGAVPIDTQVPGGTEAERQLRLVISELLTSWNFKQSMHQWPMYTAALGDLLTILVDDVDRGFVYPQVVWPGYVKDIELDYVGNVVYYAVEYPVVEVDENGIRHPYRFRQEVDKEEYRYFRNGEPWSDNSPGGHGDAVQPNPYGFVPATWDRHKVGWGERGIAATDGTRQALLEVNSLLSHSFDFQRKAFLVPIFVKGLKTKSSRLGRKRQIEAQVGRPPSTTDEVEDDIDGLAEAYGVQPVVGENPMLLQPTFDIGQTLAIIESIQEGIFNENPEARFYPELRQLSQLTGPGAERALGDAVSRCNRARAGLDANLVKRLQMSISIGAMRANNGDWQRTNEGDTRALSRRQRAFLPYSMESYHRGDLDFIIKDRPVVPPTEQERLDLILQKETIRTEWGLRTAGFEESEVQELLSANGEPGAPAQPLQAQLDGGIVIP